MNLIKSEHLWLSHWTIDSISFVIILFLGIFFIIDISLIIKWISEVKMWKPALSELQYTWSTCAVQKQSKIPAHYQYSSSSTAGVLHNFYMEKYNVKAYMQHVSNMLIRTAFVLQKKTAMQYMLSCST